MPWRIAKSREIDKKRTALVFWVFIWSPAPWTTAIIDVKACRELSFCWSLSPLLAQQIYVSTVRGEVVIDSEVEVAV
jgi:hypothetical protein